MKMKKPRLAVYKCTPCVLMSYGLYHFIANALQCHLNQHKTKQGRPIPFLANSSWVNEHIFVAKQTKENKLRKDTNPVYLLIYKTSNVNII